MYGEKIEGFEKFSTLIDVENSLPLSFLDMWALSEITAELPIAYYAGIFMLQATGLGGWMFNGMDPFSVLRASGKTDVHVLDFRYDIGERWVLPNPTGLQGMFEVYTLLPYTICARPYMPLTERKFGEGGPFNPDTPRYYKDTRKIRSRVRCHNKEFKACVALQAQYVRPFWKIPWHSSEYLCYALSSGSAS